MFANSRDSRASQIDHENAEEISPEHLDNFQITLTGGQLIETFGVHIVERSIWGATYVDFLYEYLIS